MTKPNTECFSNSTLWAREYSKGGIPSSVRAAPSNVVVDFVDHIQGDLPASTHAIDIGCGSGRNSLFLAERGMTVSAMDFEPNQIDALSSAALSSDRKIEAKVADVGKPWPWPSDAFDVAIDTFCFKHQISNSSISTYISELQRCLKKGGYFLLFLATRSDGYYKQFPSKEQHGTGLIIVDEGNQIASRLYEREEVEQLFAEFSVHRFALKEAKNKMHGQVYERSSAIWYMRNE